MLMRVPAAIVIAASLACMPAHAQPAPTPPPLVQPSPPGASRYIVPVIAGVVVGALVWPMLVPATLETGAMDAAGMARMGSAAENAVPGAASGWGWRSLSSTPVLVGGAIGGALAYILSR